MAEFGVGGFSGDKKASAPKSAAVTEVFPKPTPGVERFSGGRIRGWRVFRWQKGQGLCSKASASKSEAVRKAFPEPKPGVERFSGGRIRGWRVFPVAKGLVV